MTEAKPWSYSRVAKYESCPRAYWYKYIEHQPEAFTTVEAYMGTCVHATLEWAYKQGSDLEPETIISYYNAVWFTERDEIDCRIETVNGNELDYYLIGHKIIADFHPAYASDTRATVGLEREIKMRVADKYDFIGYIDRLAADEDGGLYIIDYKTGKHAPEEFIGKEADQLRVYGLALLKEYPELEGVVLVLEWMQAGRQTVGNVLRSDMDKIERMLRSRIEAAEVKSYSTRPGTLCKWCGFNNVCEGPTQKEKIVCPF